MSYKIGRDRRVSEYTGEVAFGFLESDKNIDVQSSEFSGIMGEGLLLADAGLDGLGVDGKQILDVFGGENTGESLTNLAIDGAASFVGNRFGTAAGAISGTALAAIPALLAAPTPLNIAAAALVIAGSVVSQVVKNARMHRDAERKGLEVDEKIGQITDMCLGSSPGGAFPDMNTYLCARAWLRYRLWESTTWFAGTAGLDVDGSRCAVKICTYRNKDANSSTYYRGSFQPAALGACTNNNGGAAFFDGSKSAKGVDYALASRATPTKKSMEQHYGQISALHDLLLQVGQSSGVSGDSGQAIQELRLSLLVSWLARLIPYQVQSVEQRVNTTFNTAPATRGQASVAVTYARFWRNFENLTSMTPELAVRPAERLFGAEESTFDDGAFGDFFQNYGEGAFRDYTRGDVGAEGGFGGGFGGSGGSGGSGGGGGGTALAGLAALGAGVLLLRS